MSNYVLNRKKNSIQLLLILDELIDIYNIGPPKFFKKCLLSLDSDIYDKIIELSLSKSHAKNWSIRYTQTVARSKEVIAAFNWIERKESREYLNKLHKYCQGESINLDKCQNFNHDFVLVKIEKNLKIY